MRFRVNTPNVVHETLDGEVIVVSARTGTYYSLLGSGAAIWEALHEGLTEDSAIDRFVEQSGSGREAVAALVRPFVAGLQAEGLIEPEPAGEAARAGEPGTLRVQGPFAAPVMEKYSDIQDLLLLDPIHEVDAAGWPKQS